MKIRVGLLGILLANSAYLAAEYYVPGPFISKEELLAREAERCLERSQALRKFSALATLAFKIASEQDSHAEKIRQFIAILSAGNRLYHSERDIFCHESGCTITFLNVKSGSSEPATEEKSLDIVLEDFLKCLERKAQAEITKEQIIQNTLKAYRELAGSK